MDTNHNLYSDNFLPSVHSISIEKTEKMIWDYDLKGIRLEVYVPVPMYTYAGEPITVGLHLVAKENLYDVFVEFWHGGSIEHEHQWSYGFTWFGYPSAVNFSAGEVKEVEYYCEIPPMADSGAVWGHVRAEWKTYEDGMMVPHSVKSLPFFITYVKDLLDKYESLETMYNNLAMDYNITRNLMFFFMITTIVFIATTVYLIARKPKQEIETR